MQQAAPQPHPLACIASDHIPWSINVLSCCDPILSMLDPDLGTDLAATNHGCHRDQLPPKLALFVIVGAEAEEQNIRARRPCHLPDHTSRIGKICCWGGEKDN